MVTTRRAIMAGMTTTMALWITAGLLSLREKTTTKENRYKDRGSTHSSGMGVMSVVINAVTPSIRLLGTNVSPTHRSRLSTVGLLGDASGSSSASEASSADEPAVTGPASSRSAPACSGTG